MADYLCFRDNDEGYRRWLGQHPDGFVLNIERDAHYGNLHAATCLAITPNDDRDYTRKRDKVCSMDRRGLLRYADRRGLVNFRVDKNCL